MIFETVAVNIHILKVVGRIQVVGQISGMEASVDSIFKKPFCSRNYDEKLGTAKAKKPRPKLHAVCKVAN